VGHVGDPIAVNTAISLLRHAFGLLTRKPLKTLWVLAPALILMCGVGVMTIAMAPELLLINPTAPDLRELRGGSAALGLIMAFIFSYAFMAILWHRYTLSDEGAPQPMGLGLLIGYLWRVLALALIQLTVSLAMVIPLILASNSGTATGGGASLWSMLLTTFVTQTVLLWLSLRLSLILPAAAMGRPIRMRLSWQHTNALSRPLWGVAAVLAAINTGLSVLVRAIDLDSPGQILALELPIYIFEGLLIFSVLTTLYARQIQQVRLIRSKPCHP
jgi:hypothetical protein